MEFLFFTEPGFSPIQDNPENYNFVVVVVCPFIIGVKGIFKDKS